MIAFLTLLLLVVVGSAAAFLVLRNTGGNGGVQLGSTVVDFGDQDLGRRSAVQTITLTNDGSGAIRVTTLGLAGAQPHDFAVADETTCAGGRAVAPNAMCTIGVRFHPTVRAPRSAELVIGLEGGAAPLRVQLRGTGVGSAAVVLETTRLDLGRVLIGRSRTGTVGLTNAGNAPLAIKQLSVRGGGRAVFRVAKRATTCSTKTRLEPGGTCTIAVAFAPTTTGPATATLEIVHDAPGSPTSVELRASGFGQAAPELSATSLDLGQVVIGASSNPRSATLTNAGTGSVTLASVTMAGSDPADFALSGTTGCRAGLRLGPGASCAIAVVFTPSAQGDRSATVEIRAGTALIATLGLTGVGTPAVP